MHLNNYLHLVTNKILGRRSVILVTKKGVCKNGNTTNQICVYVLVSKVSVNVADKSRINYRSTNTRAFQQTQLVLSFK